MTIKEEKAKYVLKDKKVAIELMVTQDNVLYIKGLDNVLGKRRWITNEDKRKKKVKLNAETMNTICLLDNENNLCYFHKHCDDDSSESSYSSF